MIAREGLPFILIGFVLTFVAIWIAAKWDSALMFGVSIVFAMLTLFTVYFFRDPDRTISAEPYAVLSPADGRIVAIDTLENHPFVGGKTLQVSIFLSVFNVHVNRVPATGRIEYVKYNPGKFLAAFDDKASLLNEQTEIGMVTEDGRKLVFKQIAGLIARRIVCRLKDGDQVSSGDRFGLIRFGSRADILMPPGTRLVVKKGDRVHGGTSVIGYLASSPDSSGSVRTGERDNAKL
jgi:phosphatidylserine decarboxylase